MKKIRVGVLGTADIAFRRFLPALLKVEEFEYYGVAVTEYGERGESNCEELYRMQLNEKTEKAKKIVKEFGGKIVIGYEKMLQSDAIDAVYIPLPPSLHYKWIQKALSHGKHVLAEKPCTISEIQTNELLCQATERSLVLMENYAFIRHRQIAKMQELIRSGIIGETRVIRATFGFPYRNASDFRYKKDLGGGSLLDCGGYTLKVAQLFMGNKIHVENAILHKQDIHDVDMYGSAVIMDENQLEAQLAFGMNNSYKCEFEIWGSKASLLAPRIYTPPADFSSQIIIKGQKEEIITLEPDDQFARNIECFGKCINNIQSYEIEKQTIMMQSHLVEEVKNKNII